MTVANTTSRNQYTATSGQTVFPYTFEIFDKGDVVVLKNGTALSEGTNYTVSGVGNDNGGNIVVPGDSPLKGPQWNQHKIILVPPKTGLALGLKNADDLE